MTKNEKKAQKLDIDAVAQLRGGVKVKTSLRAGSTVKHGPLDNTNRP